MQDFFSEQPIISLLILFALFFIFREIFCWYYKINTIVKQQKETNELLKTLINLQSNKEDKIKTPNSTSNNSQLSDNN